MVHYVDGNVVIETLIEDMAHQHQMLCRDNTALMQVCDVMLMTTRHMWSQQYEMHKYVVI